MSDTPVPRGFGLTLDPSTKQLSAEVWFGGSPPRVVRLTPAGRRAWDDLRDAPVASRRTGLLARRLTDAGLAHPVPPPGPEAPVTVVVPVRDRAAALDRCLTALGAEHPVVVVDDASLDPDATAQVCSDHRATLVRRERNGGPGAARNAGLAQVRTDLVAFVDSDCVPPPGWLDPLLAHFADPLVVAVAPRIVGEARDTWAGRYTRARGSLDLGPRAARVVPRARIGYVPSAAMVVRRSALTRLGVAFDEALRVGEDVDLVWRLHAAGGRVRYEPAVRVAHREPDGWAALLERRFRYGTSAAALGRRHPEAISPLVLHPWPALAAVGLLARRPLLGAAAATAGALAMARTLRVANIPAAGLPRASALAVGQTLIGLGRFATQFAAPLVLAGLVPRATRPAAAALLLTPPLAAWVHDRPALDPVRFVVGALADEVAYGAGVWTGSIRARTAVALRPVVAWRPLRIDSGRS